MMFWPKRLIFTLRRLSSSIKLGLKLVNFNQTPLIKLWTSGRLDAQFTICSQESSPLTVKPLATSSTTYVVESYIGKTSKSLQKQRI